jgi:hypothetical protein
MNIVSAAATSPLHGVRTAPGLTITTTVFFWALATAATYRGGGFMIRIRRPFIYNPFIRYNLLHGITYHRVIGGGEGERLAVGALGARRVDEDDGHVRGGRGSGRACAGGDGDPVAGRRRGGGGPGVGRAPGV